MAAPEPKIPWDADIREFLETTSFDHSPSDEEFLAYISQDDDSDE